MKAIICSIFFSGLVSVLSGQPLNETPPHLLIEVGEEKLLEKDYYNALDLFEQAYKEERRLDLAYKIAQLHYKLRDYKRAERWYRRVIDKDELGAYPDAIFDYAQILKINGKYEDAVEAFNIYANVVQDEARLALADNEVAGIQMAVNMEQPIELVIEHMGRDVNYSYSEYAPTLSLDGDLYFSSIKTRKLVVLDGESEEAYAKIYKSSLDKKGEWDKPKALSKKINREGYHSANATFTADGSRMYFTRSLLEGNDVSESMIYYSDADGNSWKGPQPVPNVNGDFISTHPSAGALFGSEVLFFSSNMDGGEGGFDLFYTTRTGDGEYSLPTNLGTAINTPGDEITPFFLENKLYFSSNGHAGIGGYDIFYVEWDGNEWSNPRNMGMGYNSSYDDLYYSVNLEGNKGFLVSNRPSKSSRSVKSKTCCDEMFSFNIRDIVIDLLTTVYEGETPLEGATITVFEVKNNRPGNEQSKTNPNGNELNVLLDMDRAYKAIVEKEGYFPAEFEFNTVGLTDDHTIRRTVILERSEAAEPEMETVTINQPFTLHNIYYDFDDDKILPDAEIDLQILLDLLDEYPEMVIELSSHTDARGNDNYNQRLSQRRSQSAKDWLVDHGIDDERIVAMGYGESRILNQCKNGVQCTDEEHRINRRTEFKIIEGPTSVQIKRTIPREKKN